MVKVSDDNPDHQLLRAGSGVVLCGCSTQETGFSTKFNALLLVVRGDFT